MKRFRIFAIEFPKRMVRWFCWATIFWLLWYAYGVYQRHSAWCWDEPSQSPDGQYSLNICNIRGSGIGGLYVARIYDREQRALVFEREFYSLDLTNGIYWGPRSVLWTPHQEGGADLPPDWFTRFRAKLP